MPVQPPFIVSVENHDDRVRVAFEGELDLATVGEAEAAVARARRETPGPLLLDLSGLTFLDSSGMRLVLQIDAACRRDSCELSIVPGPHGVQRVFELAGVLGTLPFAPR